MFHSRTLNSRINNLHERALRLVYKDQISSFEQLLQRDKSFCIHDRNLQKLAIEMYKVKHNLSPSFMQSIFVSTNKIYNLRNNPEFKTENIRTTHYGSETLKFRGPKTWELVPTCIKDSNSLNEFKKNKSMETNWMYVQNVQGIYRQSRIYLNTHTFIIFSCIY